MTDCFCVCPIVVYDVSLFFNTLYFGLYLPSQDIAGYINPLYRLNGTTVTGQGSGIPASVALNDRDYPGNSISYGGRQSQTGGNGQNGFNGYCVIIY